MQITPWNTDNWTGGSILSSAKTSANEKMGKNIIVAGLFVQVFFFGGFLTVTGLFHRRIYLRPTSRSQVVQVPWRRYLFVLYAAGALVMARSIFRVVEYIQGREGELQTNEVYFYVLDTLLMFVMSTVFNFYHPHTIISPKEKGLELVGRNLVPAEV